MADLTKPLRIRITSSSLRDFKRKVNGKLDEGFKVVNQGSINQYYGKTHFAVLEKKDH